MEGLVAIARIVRPRGLRGELIADVLTDFPDRFEGLRDVTAILGSEERRNLRIEDAWFQKGRVILKFEGIDSIEEGEHLREAEICVDEAEAVKLDDGEFYDWQLEGCEVLAIDGELLGKVREVMRTGGTELLVVDGEERELLIPFAEAICREVDIGNKRIVIDPPEGLLEF